MDQMAELRRSVRKGTPMLMVRDMRATVAWYVSVGFTLEDEYEADGELVFARLAFGHAELTLSPGATTGPTDVRLWLFTDQVERLYRQFNEPPFHVVETVTPAAPHDVSFDEHLYAPFYGGRQFSIRDINGIPLIFWQPAWLQPTPATGER